MNFFPSVGSFVIPKYDAVGYGFWVDPLPRLSWWDRLIGRPQPTFELKEVWHVTPACAGAFGGHMCKIEGVLGQTYDVPRNCLIDVRDLNQ